MERKYIVDNITGQTINDLIIGDLTILNQTVMNELTTQGEAIISGLTVQGQTTIGDITITGRTVSNNVSTYKALLTQTQSITGTSFANFNYGLIIGEEYTISNYVNGDDFNNIADVQSGVINETGCVFIAVGEIPASWNNGSELVSSGNLVATVLENNLGYNIDWSHAPFGGYGYYIGINNDLGPTPNAFPRGKVSVSTSIGNTYFWGGFPYISITSAPASFFIKDDVIVINVQDWNNEDTTDNFLYYTPVEITIKSDPTPVIVTGTIGDSFPFYNPSFTLYCNENSVDTRYGNGFVSNITELVSALNNDNDTNSYGVFSDDGEGGVILTITQDVKDRLCQDNLLSFNIFAD